MREGYHKQRYVHLRHLRLLHPAYVEQRVKMKKYSTKLCNHQRTTVVNMNREMMILD